jgi:hypothetical protein
VNLTLQEVQQFQNPRIITVGVIHAPRDEKSIIKIKLLNLWHATTLFSHDKDLLRLNTEGRMMISTSLAKVMV